MIEERMAEGAGLPRYLLHGDALEYGASLGNAHCWLTTRGNGSIQQFFSSDLGAAVTGSISVRYSGPEHSLLHGGVEDVSATGRASGVQLRPVEPGTTEIHPAYQRHTFGLLERLQVEETVFVPLATGDDPAVAYYRVRLRNSHEISRRINVFAFARLGSGFGADLRARYEREARGLIAADRERPASVRVFGCTEQPAAYETNHDFGHVYDVYHMRHLGDETRAEGDIMGALQVTLELQPGEQRAINFILAFAHTGEGDALATYTAARDAEGALMRTIEYVTRATASAEVLTPEQTINQGVLWSKVNMLRVMARYPQGPAFTNDPGASSAVVARDCAWFVYGNDHVRPGFSRTLLDTFARLQYENGKIPEFYHAVSGQIEDYGLNINDDTPLFVLAVNHHYRATGDLDWLRGIYPAVARAARYILSQREARGLVFCTSRDPRGDVWAIAGWRNVIPTYTLNGAVTEINAECVAALRATGHLAQNLSLPDEEARAFFDAATTLQDAMNRHLINPQNGLYYLNIDVEGIAHTDVTGDQIFPLMFRTCAEDVGFRIIRRLNHPDFWTPAGLRTVSADDPLYDPGRNLGLLGGVWPGLTWWFAFAAARYHPDLMVKALMTSFQHYASDPKKNNTVPGQFGEWFDGESLVNRGMRLSPWEPPRFLWAAVEGVCGVVLQPGKPKIQPLVPVSWRWLALRRLPYHGTEISFFATREDQGGAGMAFHIYATSEVDTEYPLEVFEEDATHMVRVLDATVCHVALRRAGKAVLMLGHTGAGTSIVALELGHMLVSSSRYRVRLYDSEAFAWQEGGTGTGATLGTCAVTIESRGFRILTFDEVEQGR